MELFQKKSNPDLNNWLQGLTSPQREALWQRFAAARASLKDSEATKLWDEQCKGKGSTQNKMKLLQVYLECGGNLKKNDCYMAELMSISKKSGDRVEEEWVPFFTIVKRFGLAETMRRVKRGTILTRQDPQDNEEWQFKQVRETSFKEETQNHDFSTNKQGKLEVEAWMKMKAKGLGMYEMEGNQGLEALAQVMPSKLKAIKDKADDEDGEEEEQPPPPAAVQHLKKSLRLTKTRRMSSLLKLRSCQPRASWEKRPPKGCKGWSSCSRV